MWRLTSANCKRLKVPPGGAVSLKFFLGATQVSMVSSLLVARLVAWCFTRRLAHSLSHGESQRAANRHKSLFSAPSLRHRSTAKTPLEEISLHEFEAICASL
ncbi:hypothetical protein EYF80_054275 [Liparis tanakae]|uniref:Uncharacterized protein n=1 Tax=Liparis tanakae TaxID=230148 RepID=A0A4Z2F512_9TELE|nr:hypothetical protein EYF80_054275 [Liparis tanakae]